MNRYALDSNIVSYLLKKNRNVAARIDKEVTAGNEIIIPPIVYYEVKRGLLYADANSQMSMFMEFCAENEIGSIDRAVLDIAADIYVALRSAGIGTEDADILIAAYCIANGYTLVTHNTRHFEGIDGLKIVDWYE